MNKPRPFLTAACFLLFVLAFASANVKPASVYCGAEMMVEVRSVQRMADEVRNALNEVIRPRDGG